MERYHRRLCAHNLALGCLFFYSSACAGQGAPSESPMRSPTLDYPPPPQQTSDGQVVGADGVPPEVKLRSGASVGPHGVAPSEGPRRDEDASPTREDPLCKSLVLDEATRKARCKQRAR
jgi:hypothetical protein